MTTRRSSRFEQYRSRRRSRCAALEQVARHRMALESLEPRQLLAVVTNTLDSGLGSLRQAVADTNASAVDDTIEFDISLMGQAITLSGGELLVTDNLTINGLGRDNLAIDGGGAANHLFVVSNANASVIQVAIAGLTLRNARGEFGAVLNHEHLALTASRVSGNVGESGGGIGNVAESHNATLELDATIVSGNSGTKGGGIYNLSDSGFTAELHVSESTISGNIAATVGGGIANYAGTGSTARVTVSDSLIALNEAEYGGGISNEADSSGNGSLAELTVTGSTISGNTAIGSLISVGYGGGSYSSGGGVLNASFSQSAAANVSISGSAVVGNRAETREFPYTGTTRFATGGGVANYAANGGMAHMTISESTISSNTAGGIDAESQSNGGAAGGGISNVSRSHGVAELTVNDSTIVENTAAGDAAAGGGIANGAIDSGSSSFEINDSTISGNTTTARFTAIGGGVASGSLPYLRDPTEGDESVTTGVLSNVRILNNSVTSSQGNTAIGGGLGNYSPYGIEARIEVRDSTISGNTVSLEQAEASAGGGGLANVSTGGSASLDVGRSTVDNNRVLQSFAAGGGILNTSDGGDATLEVSNSTISGNSATFGGGVANPSGSGNAQARIANSTIAQNNAYGGGGVYNGYDGPELAIVSSIIADNTATGESGDHDLFDGSGGATIEFSLIENSNRSPLGATNLEVDPLLGPLANNGGPTQTHLLLAGSPAIDSGSNPDELEIEQRGFGRVAGLQIDMGAVEFSSAACSLLVDTISDAVNFDDGVNSLREAILCANDTPGFDTISFAIAGAGPHVIAPLSELPTITEEVLIDGFSQAGSLANTNTMGQSINAQLRIVIEGTSAGPLANGLVIGATGGGTTLRGMNIRQFGGNGIVVASSDNVIAGNFIGTNVTGTSDSGNGNNGIAISAGGNVIGGTAAADRNLISGNDNNGIHIDSADGQSIWGNFIGINADGSAAVPNGDDGIDLDDSADNVIGGPSLASRNLISGNDSDGINVSFSGSTNNTIRNNYIGTNVTGTFEVGNSDDGVDLDSASNNLIVGNLISGNDDDGVEIDGGLDTEAGDATGNQILGNLIGTNFDGTAAIGNEDDGVSIEGASNNRVGGSGDGEGNVISGNFDGVYMVDSGANGNIVEGNLIGTDVTGTLGLGNHRDGVDIYAGAFSNVVAGNLISDNHGEGVIIEEAHANVVVNNLIGTTIDGETPLGNGFSGVNIIDGDGNRIGGVAGGEANVIAHNARAGVMVLGSSVDNSILGNSIFTNGEMGIDLDGEAVTDNDEQDADGGPNRLQNYPVLTSVSGGATTIVEGTLNSIPNSDFRLEFFANEMIDPLGFGEGQYFLGYLNVSTDAAGNAAFTFYAGQLVPPGQAITSTATRFVFDLGEAEQGEGELVPMTFLDTSEFSQPAPDQQVADLSLMKTVNDPAPEIGETVTFTITVFNAGPDNATNVVVTDLLPAGLTFDGAVTSQGTYVAATGEWTVGTVADEEFATLTIMATVENTEQITNVAEITFSDQFDPNSTPGNADPTEDDFATAGVGQCLYGLDGPLVVGLNRLVYTCPTPGSISAFVMGSEFGSFTYHQYGVTVDIADPTVKALGVANQDGVAVVHVNVPAAMAGGQIIFQAFEMDPNPQLSNLLVMNVANIPVLAAGGEGAGAEPITRAEIGEVFEEALARWQATGLSQAESDRLAGAQLRLLDLPDGVLGSALGPVIFLDRTAAGHGWFVDSSPADDAEYELALSAQERITTNGTALDRIDLLTVIMHELGHVLGHSDEEVPNGPAGLMNHELASGTRRLPTDLPEAEISHPFHNFDFAEDVNGDGVITLGDALELVSHLRRNGTRRAGDLIRELAGGIGGRFDVSRDNLVSIHDALMIVSRMRQSQSQSLAGEGEAKSFAQPKASGSAPAAKSASHDIEPPAEPFDSSYEAAVDAVLASYSAEEDRSPLDIGW